MDWAELMAALFGEYRRVLAAHPNMLSLAARRTAGIGPAGLQLLLDQGFAPDDAVELYQSLAAMTVGYSMLSSAPDHASSAGLPTELAVRAGEWRDDTLERALRVIIDEYRSRLRQEAQGVDR